MTNFGPSEFEVQHLSLIQDGQGNEIDANGHTAGPLMFGAQGEHVFFASEASDLLPAGVDTNGSGPPRAGHLSPQDLAVGGMTMSSYLLPLLLMLSRPSPNDDASTAIQAAELTKLFSENGQAFDRFGRSVGIDGDRLVVGTDEVSFAGSPNTLKGSAYVYSRTPSGWCFDERLVAFDAEEWAFFGWSSAIDADTIVVGSINKDTPNGVDAGKAYTFVRTSNAWVSQGGLVPSQGSFDAEFGSSVDVDGDTILVGAPRDSSGGISWQGAAYVFTRTNGVWSEQARLTGDPVANLVFGGNVTIRGDRAFCSSGLEVVYAFERTGTTWTPDGRLSPSEPALAFAGDLDFDGQTLWVGAAGDPFAANAAGSVFSFVQQNGEWVQEQRILPLNPFASQFFGAQVAVDGDWGAVAQLGVSFQQSFIYVFHRENGEWCEVERYGASDDYAGLNLGSSLAFDGATVLAGTTNGIGVPAPEPTGAAYVHVLDLPPAAHCSAPSHSEGCVPQLAWTGSASLSAPTPFDVTATDVVATRNGLFFYGLAGPADVPFAGGSLCVEPPLRRTPVQPSGGQAGVPCDGTLTFDVNAWLQAGNEPFAGPGSRIDGQFWFRDDGDPAGIGLTSAVGFHVNP